ncbi:MAG TPA: hypothetical protein VHT03_06375 [Rhizomicrobium sp.]|nr:hypothetical protein [Rhizomicrobium sp.]
MKKGFWTAVALGGAIAAIAALMRAPAGSTGPTDPCGDWVNSHMPAGAFLVVRTGNKFLLDHNGIREGVSCTVNPDGTVKLRAEGFR